MGSKRMQAVGIFLAIILAAFAAYCVWRYRPVSLAEAMDAQEGGPVSVIVVMVLDETDSSGSHLSFSSQDPALLAEMQRLLDSKVHFWRKSDTMPLNGLRSFWIIGADKVIGSFHYSLERNLIYADGACYTGQGDAVSALIAAVCQEDASHEE